MSTHKVFFYGELEKIIVYAHGRGLYRVKKKHGSEPLLIHKASLTLRFPSTTKTRD